MLAAGYHLGAQYYVEPVFVLSTGAKKSLSAQRERVRGKDSCIQTDSLLP